MNPSKMKTLPALKIVMNDKTIDKLMSMQFKGMLITILRINAFRNLLK